MDNLQKLVMSKAEKWLGPEFDEATRKEVQNLIDNDPKNLVESFNDIRVGDVVEGYEQVEVKRK